MHVAPGRVAKLYRHRTLSDQERGGFRTADSPETPSTASTLRSASGHHPSPSASNVASAEHRKASWGNWIYICVEDGRRAPALEALGGYGRGGRVGWGPYSLSGDPMGEI